MNVIDALMHSGKMHSCRYREKPMRHNTNAMQEQQRVIVEWMRDAMERHGLNAAQWAKKACELSHANGLPCTLTGPTITKAMKESYPFVTKATTLSQLAAVIGEDPPGQSKRIETADLIPLPTREALEAMLREHYSTTMRGKRASDDLVSDLAQRMHDTLVSLREDPDAARVPEAARSAALHIGRAHDR